MQVFSPSFTTERCFSIVPTKAHNWKSLRAVKSSYAEFVTECEKYNESPGELPVYQGQADGTELQSGYHPHPDYVIYVGPQGGIVCAEP